MKYITKSFLMLCLSLLLCTSCDKNDGFYYQDVARVRLVGPSIWTLDTDSLEFSFLTYSEDVTEMQMDVEVWLMGETVDYDRTANIVVNSSLTTASSDMYEVPSTVTIPAGEHIGELPVILKRDEILEETTVRLYIEVAASEDFEIGTNEYDHLLLKWTDQISKPSYWDDITEHFGTYSDTKYRFMIQTSGVSEFDPDDMTWAQLHHYNIMFTNALNEYNSTNDTPLTDENGALVTFPES